jgi:hypothetical protein
MPEPPPGPPGLFDVTTTSPADPAGALVRVPLDELELDPNARREIAPEGIERLARVLASMTSSCTSSGASCTHDRHRTGPTLGTVTEPSHCQREPGVMGLHRTHISSSSRARRWWRCSTTGQP